MIPQYKNRKFIFGGLFSCLFTLTFTACFSPPEYDNIPKIEFDNLQFIDIKDPSSADSLVLAIRFQDGDGDLGLQSKDTTSSTVNGKKLYFNDKFYPKKRNGEPITYADKRTHPELNLPDYVKPYTCTNWEIIKNQNTIQDTIYFELNENHYNIFVEFYIKQNDGSFKQFDWLEKFCTTFNGRFPVLAKDLGQKTPLEGTLYYTMKSTGFKIQFSLKTLKLKVRIQDRLQQKSNEIETPEFRFI